jgi:redox-sensitive bicupin YhaK (pirin superfamily)
LSFIHYLKERSVMKTTFYKADTRGHANHGWLDSWHTFSFAQYYDPNRSHFGALRVLNDDYIAAGMGFGTHPHDNFEIVTIPLEGAVEHRDSMGNHGIIKRGDVQIMSAGSGIAHSEFNASKDEALKLFQIWVFPKERNITPRYDQKTYPLEGRKNSWQVVVSPKDEGAVWINQDAYFNLGHFDANNNVDYTMNTKGNGVFLMVVEGEAEVDGQKLSKRDAIGVWDVDSVSIKTNAETELLAIEIPMAV